MRVVVVVIVCAAPFTVSFNLEPLAATHYSYPYADTQGRGAYFGYAVALQYSARDRASWVVVGAPRANSSHHDESTITEPGAVFICPFSPDEEATCNELNIDPTGNTVNTTSKSERYKDLKNYGFLGGSLDIHPHFSNDRLATLVCAPLWRNQLNASEVYVNGACYWTGRQLSDGPSFQKELPLLDRKNQIRRSTYVNAYGQLGFSVHFADDSRKMIMGVPGALNWTGKAIIFEDYQASKTVQERKKREVETPKVMFDDIMEVKSSKVEMNDFLGYAVTSGMFWDPRREVFAAGAPRSDGLGKVVMFEFTEYEYEEVRHTELTGEQTGEYFGAALTAGDINNDGLTDLVIGAPMYSSVNHPDVGRIHVYMSEEGQGLISGPHRYYGRTVDISRFGTTLATADLNMDSYQDVVVGAPWEGGVGAVYVFQGSAEGLQRPHSQYLSPEDFTPGLRGFGMALSRGVDVDDNGYPDLVIGSILADKAVLVRTRPVAVLTVDITANPRTVPFEEEAHVTLKACIHYGGHKIPSGVKVEASFTLDQQTAKPRAVLTRWNTSTATFMQDLVPHKDVCWEEQLLVQKDKVDPDSPITLKLSYVLNSSQLELIEQPVMNPQVPMYVETDLSIAKGCLEEVCKVDMWTRAAFLDGDNTSVVIGKANKLEVTVYNRGEHVYLPNMTVSVAPPLMVFPPHTHECTYLDTTKTNLLCHLANPIKNSSEPDSVVLSVKVDERQMNESTGLVSLEIQVTGEGEEQGPDDNTVSLSLQLATKAQLLLHGSSLEEQVAYEHKEKDLIVVNNLLTFNHTYILVKNGPTALETIGLHVDIPDAFVGELPFAHVTLGETRFSGHVDCTWNDLGGTGPDPQEIERVDEDGDIVVEALAGAEVGKQYFNCSSDNIHCTRLYCQLSKWLEDMESARITIKFEVDLSVLGPHMSVHGGAVLGSRSTATILDLDPQLAFIGNREVSASTVTLIQPETPTRHGIPWWVILLAVLGGILLLALLAYVLYKKGFFKREKMEEMKAHRARLESAPTGISNPTAIGE